ncbi:hypothetical protein [Mycobacterium malmoense]|uniref:hypothetical protein n=1 Tax=Mycobacterium malmoense TaxID=1780 RepID=UPI00114655A0|nr:hypothetical protein [Mycobacterium malmoense]
MSSTTGALSVFQRDTAVAARSLPAYRFRDDSTLANDTYWHTRLAFKACSYEISKSEREGHGNVDPMVALRLEPEWERKLGVSVTGLREPVAIGERHARLATLVHVTSSLERYVSEIARLSALSDPLLTPGFPKRVDGLALVNQWSRIHLKVPSTEALVRGEWSSRIASIREWMGNEVADIFIRHEPLLERMRKLRNAAAHDLGSMQPNWDAETAIQNLLRSWIAKPRVDHSISDDALIDYMRVAQRIVDATDKMAIRDFIGGYELAAIYASWLHSPKEFEQTVGIQMPPWCRGRNRFIPRYGRKLLASVHPLGSSVTFSYVGEVRDYLDRLGAMPSDFRR